MLILIYTNFINCIHIIMIQNDHFQLKTVKQIKIRHDILKLQLRPKIKWNMANSFYLENYKKLT